MELSQSYNNVNNNTISCAAHRYDAFTFLFFFFVKLGKIRLKSTLGSIPRRINLLHQFLEGKQLRFHGMYVQACNEDERERGREGGRRREDPKASIYLFSCLSQSIQLVGQTLLKKRQNYQKGTFSSFTIWY